jgi:hypothetical protein
MTGSHYVDVDNFNFFHTNRSISKFTNEGLCVYRKLLIEFW